ncbi:MAG: beta-ketoacyl-ACP synthase II [Treponema sp.]|nr:beta-ketoacyl-ACP synthase II [Treponema sp.]
MERRRVVVTGLGVVSPIGKDADETWKNAKEGKSGAARITLFNPERLDVQIAAEVKDFSLENYSLNKKLARRMARFTQLALASAVQAVNDAGYNEGTLKEEKCAVVLGCCIGGIDACSEGFEKLLDPAFGPSRIPPFTTPLMISNEASANISMHYGLKNLSWTLTNACASGTDSLGLALDLIRAGRCDMCITGGTDSCITEFSVACYEGMNALARNYNDAPEKASRPFDKKRCGFLLAEGSAVLIFEELEHAKKRGAKIYAEVAGFGASCDAYHIAAPLQDGSGAALAVNEALEDACLKPQDIQYYNAHGTSTMSNDSAETAMLHTVFGPQVKKLRVSSTKSMTGHLIGAAGSIEAFFCVKAVTDDFIPPTINLEDQDTEGGCDLDYTPNKGIQTEVNAAMSASLGFGGHNGCIIIKKYKE